VASEDKLSMLGVYCKVYHVFSHLFQLILRPVVCFACSQICPGVDLIQLHILYHVFVYL